MIETSSRPSPWLRRYHDGAARQGTRVVLLPHAGGSANNYRALSGALGPGLDVVCVQYPGRQDRFLEPPISDLRTLAAETAAALRAEPAAPLVLFGHSMGSLVAIEVAHQLEQAGSPVTALFASGGLPPSLPERLRLQDLDDRALLAELAALGGLDEGLLDEPELMSLFLPTLRADCRALVSYAGRSAVRVSCPVTAVTGDDDPCVTVDEARLWARHTAGRFELRVFPGGHFYLDEHLASVAELVRAAVPR